MPPVRRTDDVRPLRVLIVDAHEVSLMALAALLRTEGFVVADAAPSDPVIDLARAFKPDVVLIDPRPVSQCREVTRQLRSLERTPRVVVMSSAEPDRLDPFVRRLPFLAKADVCAEAILRAVAVASDESQVAAGPSRAQVR
jgi:CheY-like chemotaxis protein